MQSPAIGDRFEDRYELRAILGRGGAGIVYRAVDLRSSREVALKILAPPASGHHATTVSRFHREVKIIAGLRSPATVTLFDSGETRDGLLYMTFEYIEGRDLEEVIFAGEQLSEATVAHILTQLLGALDEAHSLGLLHRDIKPANIRIFQQRRDPYAAKLLDFGIARYEGVDHTMLTMEGALIGTPPFMAPEQITGDELSAATDLYALGLVAYEMLTGRAAVDGASQYEIFDRHLHGGPIELPPEYVISRGLREIVEKMTRRRPEDRPQSARKVVEALGELRLSSEPVAVRPLENISPRPTIRESPPPPEPQETGRGTLYLAGLLGVAAVAGGIAFATLAGGEDERPSPEESTAVREVESPERVAAEDGVEGLKLEFAVKNARRGTREALAASAAEALGGCGVTAPPQLSVREISVAGHARRYAVRAPTGHEPPQRLPMVLMFPSNATRHPKLGDFARDSEIYAAADRHGFAVVSLFSWAPPMVANWTNSELEVQYAKAVIDDIAQRHCIDPNRIYALGHGLGADFLDIAGCELPVAAIATNAAIGSTSSRSTCIANPVAHMHLRGRQNALHPPEGTSRNCLGAAAPSLAKFNEPWLEANGCANSWEPIDLHPAVDCRRAKGCTAPYVVCEHPDGYEWRSTQLEGFSSECLTPQMSFDGAEVVWRFFEGHKTSDRTPGE